MVMDGIAANGSERRTRDEVEGLEGVLTDIGGAGGEKMEQ